MAVRDRLENEGVVWMDARHRLDVGETANEAEVGLEVQSSHVFISLPATLRTWGGLRIMAPSPG